MSLTIEHFSDREFLLIMQDTAEDDGWTDSMAVAQHISANGDLDKLRRSVAIRLSWLFRFGAVEREHERDEHGALKWHKDGRPMHTQRWRLTPTGEKMALGKLKKSAENALGALTEAELLAATRIIASKQRDASEVGSTLVKREWRFGTSKLRNGNGR